MKYIPYALILLVVSTLAYGVTSPTPNGAVQSNAFLTPACASGSNIAVQHFEQTASSGISGTTLTVTDGVHLYASTINTSTGAQTCFVQQ